VTQLAVVHRATAELAVPESPEVRRSQVVHRLRQLAACVGLTALCITQDSGRIISDTKLDMAINPLGFLARAGELWNAQWQFGTLQNQATGYFFPMGPFFLGGATLDISPWLVQRLWMSALLCVAFLGMVQLAARMGIGSPNTRLIAAAVFAVSPRALSLIGTVSAELIPYCLAPWALLPLVWGAQRGQPRRAAALSGLAVVCMSGINAAAVACAVLPSLIFLLTRAAGPRRRRLLAWWLVAMVLATLWWSVSLALLSVYGFPFLPYTESATVTTGTTSLTQVIRGANHWVGHLVVDGQPWWRAGWTIVSNPVLIVAAGVLGALGLAGLARRDLVERRFLGYCALIGVTLIGIGYVARFGSPLAESARTLLDGPLAPLRNVHKFDVVLRLPLALGVAHLLAVWRRPAAKRAPTGPVEYHAPGRDWRPGLIRITAVTALLVVAGGAASAGLPAVGSVDALPAYWRQTADWLDENAGDSSTLLVPGSNFGEYTWGRTMDEPIQPLLRSRWAVRALVPGGSTGNARLLAAIDERLAAGATSPGLSEVLGRLGVRYLVVRNDLSRPVSGVAWPVVVHRTLDSSPGLRQVAQFGPSVGLEALAEGVWDYNLRRNYPAVEIYRVSDPSPVVRTLGTDRTLRLTGAPETLLDLADVGHLAGRPVVLDGDDGAPANAVPVLADSLRWREVDFGLVRDNTSATLSVDERPRQDRGANDLVEPAWNGSFTTATYGGVREVRASSSAAEVGGPPALRNPSALPYAAIDGDPETAWLTDGARGVRGQWWEIRFQVPTSATTVKLRTATGKLLGPGVNRIAVSTETGRLVHSVLPGGGEVELPVPAGDSRWLRITVLDVAGKDNEGQRGGISELSIPGVRPQRVLTLPPLKRPPSAPEPVVTLARRAGDRPACTETEHEQVCAPLLARRGEEPFLSFRQFSLDRSYRPTLTGLATPRPQHAAIIYARQMRLPQFLTSSNRFTDPVASGFALGDGDDDTIWWARPEDPEPTITIGWPGPRRVDRIRFRLPAQIAASAPRQLLITGDNGSVEASVDATGKARFPALVTASLRITVVGVLPRYNRSIGEFDEELLPVGAAGLDVPAVPQLNQPPDLDATVSLPCGGGPRLRINGLVVQTRAKGTLRDIRDLRPLRYFQCDSAFPVFLRGGLNSVSAELDGFIVDSAVFGDPAGSRPERAGGGQGESTASRSADARPVEAGEWGSVRRTVQVGAGQEAFLALTENANTGWRATLDGKPLRAVRLDGWRQGWVVPAGDGGTVKLEFLPGRLYLGAEALGVLGVLVLVLLALVRRRPAELQPAPAAARDSRWAKLATVALATALGGAAGLVISLIMVVVGWRRPPPAFLIFWPVVAAVICEGLFRWRAAGDVLGRDVVDALQGNVAQALCLVAISALLMRLHRHSMGTAVVRRMWFGRRAMPMVVQPAAIEAGAPPEVLPPVVAGAARE